ncbi:MAG: hypothetical protein IPG91_13060 [Ideonella sp.]|nr:hypothetical protein [Ideonella sp.]
MVVVPPWLDRAVDGVLADQCHKTNPRIATTGEHRALLEASRLQRANAKAQGWTRRWRWSSLVLPRTPDGGGSRPTRQADLDAHQPHVE